ncbi:sensor histidine kinase [Rhodoferax sp.]|uniref:sensor histidine kinase n=1 Tax=Rhodoferax sp. TaxID=50421 RepID=UPI0027564104|nr:histidine kinase [Rhodoferax sp.]
MNIPTTPQANHSAWAAFAASCVSGYHRYASWLVSITWRWFLIYAVLLIIAVNIIDNFPPFSWTYTELVPVDTGKKAKTPNPPKPPRVELESSKAKKSGATKDSNEGVDISIDQRGIRITPRVTAPAAPALPDVPGVPASGAPATDEVLSAPGVTIKLPPGADSQTVREVIDVARREVRAAMDEARQDAKDAARDAAEAAAEALRPRIRTRKYGEPLVPLAMWFILISGIIKVTYKGKVQAEAKAAQATEVAESESLKRQVVEARMAAMQAQVEPHFLFNTLASIDHLIETDPPRASIMQKNLIALLRASMPTMREANAQTTRDLGRELAVIRPYLEILKVRMEERLQTEVRVSDGLLSAEFPPMMLQSLVENAIKHGLEPKAEGGQLTVSAEIVHGKLAVTVADTGLGFGKAATAGTGIGLSNIRERLALLYGNRASLTVSETVGGGTTATITVPYTARPHADDAAPAPDDFA